LAKQYSELNEKLIDFINNQHLFFVGTAGETGFVNVSPKGMDSFRVLSNTQIAWLNLTGSGNESAAHVLENARMTILFCSFDKQPMILRLYGKASVIYPDDNEWESLSALFPNLAGARQLFKVQLDLVQTSCGFAVPHYEFISDRMTLDTWAKNKGEEGVKRYWQQNNTLSLNGKKTGIKADRDQKDN
jgi:hypothetical protein